MVPEPLSAPRLTVVVMAYDEAASLEAVVRELDAAAARATGGSHEVLVVDDGSRDGTGELADRLAAELPAARVVHHPGNRGLGGVYRTGYAEARGTLVTFFPADGQFPASIVEDFVPRMEGRDLVLGYVERRTDSLRGRLLSLGERLLYRALFGRLPRFQGVMMFRRAILDALPLRSTGRGWGIVMELLVRATRKGLRVESVPTPLRPRAAGRSKVQDSRTVWANLRQALELRRLL